MNIAFINPIRYRGYYYDSETGLYYLKSRYYDPETGRFINADGYASTGQGVLGNNMFAYCNNNPVMYSDPSGCGLISNLIKRVIKFIKYAKDHYEPYKSADEAARAFSEEVYSSSLYIRHEYGTEIYSRTVSGVTTYNYNPPHAGEPHSVDVNSSSPEGTTIVAAAHTHLFGNTFSEPDKSVAMFLNINTYVVGPNLELQRYNVSSGSITSLGVISPTTLTDAQRDSLVANFEVSWDEHIMIGCEYGCFNITWPTP